MQKGTYVLLLTGATTFLSTTLIHHLLPNLASISYLHSLDKHIRFYEEHSTSFNELHSTTSLLYSTLFDEQLFTSLYYLFVTRNITDTMKTPSLTEVYHTITIYNQ